MILTYRIDTLPTRQRPTYLACATKREGNVITIDTATPCARELFDVGAHLKPAHKCCRCGGAHDVAECPIPADTSPEIERRRATQGGCCGEPSQSSDG